MSEHPKMQGEAAPAAWRQMLDERQRKAIAFAETYVRDFNHGTVGHNEMVLGPKGTPVSPRERKTLPPASRRRRSHWSRPT